VIFDVDTRELLRIQPNPLIWDRSQCLLGA
jgi:hypothetical protein